MTTAIHGRPFCRVDRVTIRDRLFFRIRPRAYVSRVAARRSDNLPHRSAFWHNACFFRFRRNEHAARSSSELLCEPLTTVGIDLKGRCVMLGWAITFLVLALIAGALGFSGVMGTAVNIAYILFVVFLVLFLVSLVVPKVRPPV
jgi:uncharacterized membrane protein YtjA (UPF0391 family)